MKLTDKIPVLWVSTLYLAEGIPYIIVNNISVALFADLGVPNGQMAFYTSLLYLPWVIKPLWSPLVDRLRTKRWWIVVMQLLLTACFIGLTLTIPYPSAALIAAKQTPVELFLAMIIIFWVTAFASATHDIAADGYYMLALNEKQQAIYVGIRSTFYRIATILGQGALLFLAGQLVKQGEAVSIAWQITLLVASIFFGILTCWHCFALPKTEKTPITNGNAQDIWSGIANCFITFFSKKGAVLAIIFMLLYRLPEAFSLKLIIPFMMDSAERGGLGLGTDDIGIIYSTIGIIFLTIGGIIGGIYIAKVGLKRALWPMALCMTLPCLAFVYLSMTQPTIDSNIAFILQRNWWIVTCAIAVEQLGYGFGFTAYMMYMIHFSEGEYKTAHYALCTAFMALSMMLPGLIAGHLQELLGYTTFFWMVMVCCLATVVVTAMARQHCYEKNNDLTEK